MSESTISNHWGVAAPSRYFLRPSVNELINQLFSHKAVYRTAAATPGLLNIHYSMTLADDRRVGWPLAKLRT